MSALNKKFILCLLILICFSYYRLIAQDIAPQIWNNFNVGWSINEHFSWRNNASYNVLISKEYPWYEITLTSTGVYKFQRFYEVSLGFYFARTKQTLSLSSIELRPFVGFRITTNPQKKWLVTNLGKIEMRNFIYSDNDISSSWRFRNRTYLALALTNESMNDNNNLFVFAYFEVFYNFGQEVRERFFNQFKYKLGLGYRLSSRWNFDLGVIYQDSKITVIEPVNPTTNTITNYIIEWGITYIIPPRWKD